MDVVPVRVEPGINGSPHSFAGCWDSLRLLLSGPLLLDFEFKMFELLALCFPRQRET
jgi:hypothetical protein